MLSDPDSHEPNMLLIGSGSELHLIVEAQKKLAEQKIYARVVSMPSWELFDAQSQEYKDTVFPEHIKARLAVEAGIRQGWDRYLGCKGSMISIEHFGASAPAAVLMKEFGFTTEHVVEKSLECFRESRDSD